MSETVTDVDAEEASATHAKPGPTADSSLQSLEKLVAVGDIPNGVAAYVLGASVAIGANTRSTADSAIAIGVYSSALSTKTVSIGAGAHGGAYAVTVGAESAAGGGNSVALGPFSYASHERGVAIGRDSQAAHVAAVALGSNSITTKDSSISVGSVTVRRAICNLADGELSSSSREAVTGSQLFATNQKIERLQSVDAYVKINQTGTGATATSSNMAIGQDANASGYIGIAFGVSAKSTGTYGAALGYGAEATDNAVAFGYAAKAIHARAVALGSQSTTDRDNTVSVGSLAQRRAIRFLADGELSASSHEAVTGRQLFATNQQVETHTTAIERNAESIAANATRVNELSQQIDRGSVGLVRQDGASRALTLGVETDGAVIQAAGTQGARRLSGLAQGQDASDAATVGQLGAALNDPLLARYDTPQLTELTFNRGGNATRLGNVANGQSPSDVVNLGQLDTAIGAVDGKIAALTSTVGEILKPLGDLNAAAVKYDETDKSRVTFNSQGPGTVLGHVLAGERGDDAVNKSQLDAVNTRLSSFSGALGDVVRQVDNLDIYAVKHDAGTSNVALDDSRITGLANGMESADAVNKGQLDGAVESLTEKLAGAVVYSDAAHTLVMLNPGKEPVRVGNVAAGTGKQDAVNFSQLSPVLTKTRFLMVTGDADATATGDFSTVLGSGAKTLSSRAVAVGVNAAANAADVAIGRNAKATSERDGENTFAGVAVGNSSESVSSGVAVGQLTKALGRGAIAIGNSAAAREILGASIGFLAEAAAQEAIAFGSRARSLATSAVALGARSIADAENTVSVGSSLKRRLTNVAAGFEEDDAVTVRQFGLLRLEHEQLQQTATAQYLQLSEKNDALQAQLLRHGELAQRAEAQYQQLEHQYGVLQEQLRQLSARVATR